MDNRVLKIWGENEGKPFAAIETEHGLNDFCRYPNSGKFSNVLNVEIDFFMMGL